jgi:hypothetical protein
MQRGGKLLGKGRYGCAFSPPLLCKGDKKYNGRSVGKLTEKHDGAQELGITFLLKKQLSNPEQYFILIEDSCSVKPRAQQKERDLSKCESASKMNEMVQLVMPFGGRPLFLVPRLTSSLDFFKVAQHLLEAGTMLLVARVVHYDLHQMNVLIQRGMPRIIDFGMAWQPEALSLSNVHQLELVATPESVHQTPEHTAMFAIQSEMTLNHICALMADKKDILNLIYRSLGIPVQKQLEQLKEFCLTSISFHERDWYTFQTTYWMKFDAWAIGAILLSVFSDLLVMDPNFERDPRVGERLKTTMDVCRGLLQTDPGKRLDAAEALEKFAPDSEVLQEPKVQDWLAKQKAVRAELEKKIGVY